MIVTACIKAEMPVIAGLLLVSSLLKAWAFFPIIFRAYFKAAPEEEHPIKGDCDPMMRVPLILTALFSIIVFFYPYYILGLAQFFAERVLMGGL